LGNLLEYSKKNSKFKASRFVGVEPSQDAIDDGKARYPGVEFHKGLLTDVPLGGSFDLVIVNFVLHWVDRSTLSKSISEIDRLVSRGGYLVIGDFLPDSPTRVPYGHWKKDEMFTYKQDYAKIFEAFNLYRELSRVTFHHDKVDYKIKDVASHDRVYWSLLKKSLTEYYFQK
jgi:SAM-dependent methyltransferase